MLELRDFFHLPEVDTLVEQMVADRPGLVVVAGLDPRPLQSAATAAADAFLPSGRSAVFGILARRLLAANGRAPAIIVAQSKSSVRVPDGLRRRVKLLLAETPVSYADLISQAARQHPRLLVIDRLDDVSARAALEMAQAGIFVLAQLDCVLVGAGATRHLLDLGVPEQMLGSLRWVIAVQRLQTLCPHCRREALLESGRLQEISRRYGTLPILQNTFYQAAGCAHCGHTGRYGDVAAFDFFRAAVPPPALFEQPSLLSMPEYVLQLALLGQLPVDDLLHFEDDQLRRTYLLLAASERALGSANSQLQRRLAELEAANRVLEQRTQSLVSLQETSQTLITSIELDELADRICRRVRTLCGADRAVFYLLRADSSAEVVAVTGWDPGLVGSQVDTLALFGPGIPSTDPADGGPTPFSGWPPGIARRSPDVEGAELQAGLRVPLIAQNEVVGLMLVHSTRKPRFSPGEVALLQAFANQAALAVQRAGLVEELRDKIVRLEAAQAELIRKERLERELELARQVQQTLLPRVFPELPGYRFAARSEAARRVGGDFYDVFRIDEAHFGLAIADVSDKGMPAALFMALTRSLLLAEGRRALSPKEVLLSVHRLLVELGDPGMFVTVFYGVVDTRSRVLTYTRAGHEEPLLLRDGSTQPLRGQGTVLGFLDEGSMTLSEEQVLLDPGDRLVLFTDGLADALSVDGRRFGLERLEQVLRRRNELGADELCEAVFAELADHQGKAEQFDDMAMLVVEAERKEP